MVIGSLIFVVSSWFIYGFGELIENYAKIAKIAEIAENRKRSRKEKQQLPIYDTNPLNYGKEFASKTIFCTSCGAQLASDAVFCTDCGNQIQINTNKNTDLDIVI